MYGEPLAKLLKIMPKSSKEERIKVLIFRRRQQIWVHSMIYYCYNANIVSDMTWSQWGEDLECLQNMYPDLSRQVPYYEEFKDFDHSTGQNLPKDNEQINAKAEYLLKININKYGRNI